MLHKFVSSTFAVELKMRFYVVVEFLWSRHMQLNWKLQVLILVVILLYCHALPPTADLRSYTKAPPEYDSVVSGYFNRRFLCISYVGGYVFPLNMTVWSICL